MKKRIWIVLTAAFLLFGCGADTDSEQSQPNQPQIEKDRIDRVSDAASTFGYDGEAIEKGLREADELAGERNDAMEEIFDE